MPHHFCIFNFTWFTNLNILDLNKYAEHQLKVQIEVFCSNQFFSRRALFSCSQQFLQQTQALFAEQSRADPGFLQRVHYFNNSQKMNLPHGEMKDVLWVVTDATWLCGHPLADGGDRGSTPVWGKISHLFAANIHEALGNTFCGQSRHEGCVSLKLH